MTTIQNIRSRSTLFLHNKRQTFLNWAIILVLFAAVIGVVYVGATRDTLLTWIMAGTLGIWGSIVLFRLGRFEYGVIGIMLTAALINFFTLPTGRESRVVISMVVALALVGIWVLQIIVSKGKVRIRPSPINRPLFLFIIVSVIAYVWSIVMRDPLLMVWDSFPFVQLAALMVNILLPLVGLMVSNKVRETRWLKIFAWIMIALGVFVVFSNLLGLPVERLYRSGSRGLFSTWVVSMALAMGIFNERLSMKVRGGLLGLVLVWTYYSLFTQGHWLSGWLPFMVAGAVITWNRSKKLFMLGVVGVILVTAIRFETFYERIYVHNVEDGSAQRAELWTPNIELVSRHPIFGTGPAGYAIYYMTYHPHNARSTHNNYFDVLAQTGFVGFAIFIWLFGTFIVVGNRLRRKLKGQRNFKEAFANATFGGVIAAMVAMMLGDWILPFAYNQTITGFDNAVFSWIFLGSMVSLYHIIGVGEKGDKAVSIRG
jgi:O-antigen ligase